MAFGDSITALNRWVKPLQRRLFDAYGGDYALMNAGISGNCLLYDIPGLMGASYGEKGVSRFERDVLRFSGLCGVILALGVNDVAYYSQKTGAVISLEQYASAVRQNLIIQHLHMQENGLGRWDIIHRWGRIVWWIRESGSATTRHYVAKN